MAIEKKMRSMRRGIAGGRDRVDKEEQEVERRARGAGDTGPAAVTEQVKRTSVIACGHPPSVTVDLAVEARVREDFSVACRVPLQFAGGESTGLNLNENVGQVCLVRFP